MEIRYCFIKEAYFKDHKDFVNMLDTNETKKQSHRTHICLCIEENNNKFFIPLRNNLGEEIRKFGRIGHAIPSQKRDKAGLDFRYTLIVNEEKYIEWQKERKIPKAQYKAIEKDFDIITREFEVYLNGYMKAARKRRVNKEPLYRVSSLINFDRELGIN